jgi:hypothetical protein
MRVDLVDVDVDVDVDVVLGPSFAQTSRSSGIDGKCEKKETGTTASLQHRAFPMQTQGQVAKLSKFTNVAIGHRRNVYFIFTCLTLWLGLPMIYRFS